MIISDTKGSHYWVSLPAVLRRRKYTLAIPILAGLALGVVGYANTPSAFLSEAVVALDVRRVHALPTETVVSPLPQESPVLRTELDVIRSRSMAIKVIARLESEGVAIRLDDHQGSSIAWLRDLANGWFRASAQPAGTIEDIKALTEAQRHKVDALLRGFSVTNDGRSYTIFLSFISSDPIFASKVANAYALSYLDHQIEVQRTATRRVSDWLGETLVSLRADLEASEKAAEDFRQGAGLVKTDGAILQAQRVSALNSELAVARAAFAGTQARLNTIRTVFNEGNLPALAEILGSETIQTLRIEQARLERRLRELQDSKALKSAEMASIQSELAVLKEQVNAEVERIAESLSHEVAIAREKEEGLEAALRQARGELSEANHAEVSLAQLEREVAANRTIYESYLVRYKQTIEQDGIAAPEAQIISFAEPADSPSKPRLSAWLLFGLGFGGSVAVAGTILREATDRRPRLRQTLEEATGVAVVGALTQVPRKVAANWRNAGTTLSRSLSTMRKILRITPTSRQPLSLVVTSTFENEGKTMLVMGLASSATAAGMRTVIIDANFTHGAIAQAFGVKAHAYLDEYDGSDKSFDRLLHKDVQSGAHFIVGRAGAPISEIFLAGPRFAALMDSLKARFDLVLIDTPGLATAPDALDAASQADRLLFVVDFQTRHPQQVIASIRSLSACGHRPDGIILNRVSRRSHSELMEELLAPSWASADPIPTADRKIRQIV